MMHRRIFMSRLRKSIKFLEEAAYELNDIGSSIEKSAYSEALIDESERIYRFISELYKETDKIYPPLASTINWRSKINE